MNGNEEETRKKILETLRQHAEGLTITELANAISAHRQTVAKYLLVLAAEGTVTRRQIGPATLHYLSSKSRRAQ